MLLKEKETIQMVDLQSQYQQIKSEIDTAILDVVASAHFIKGPAVKSFETNLANYLNVKHVIACANGTDALQIALMALGLQPGDEVIVPAFTYVATAEVIALLGLKPVMVDVASDTFNTTVDKLKNAIGPKTKAIVPVHLFGQCTDMEPLLNFAKENNLFVVEDNAQAIGASYRFTTSENVMAGTMGDIGTTSFFPSKNLGCYGDGGAMFTNDDALAEKIRTIANHGQKKKYHHSVIGCNSRLDTIQAAVLDIKLKHLDQYAKARQEVAAIYDEALKGFDSLQIPVRQANSTHVFHQYTLIVKKGQRDALQKHLGDNGIPTGIYYPIPLYKQEAFETYVEKGFELKNTETLCQLVLSLPIHTEMERDTQAYIIQTIYDFFNKFKA
jgi:UDP-2-acetamido-2-deoxy-ribo-hexuluronate aminotransferase